MKTPKLENWSIVGDNNPYLAPELMRNYAKGLVYGHESFPEGQSIRTSALVEFNLKRRYVKTQSGTKYMLGKMNPDYAAYRRTLKKGTK